MMKTLINVAICIAAFVFTTGCSENDRMIYGDRSGVYLPDYKTGADSLVYSFTFTQEDWDTVNVTVKLLGELLKEPTAFRVKIDPASTAVPGMHYEALPENFTFPAGQSVVRMPVNVLKKGTELDNKIVTLILRLEASEKLDIGYADKAQVRIMITNQLVYPSYWDDILFLYFGDYSKVKHQKCIDIMGHDFPLKESDLLGWNGVSNYSYWMRAGREVCNYYAAHPEVDENGNLIEAWEPF